MFYPCLVALIVLLWLICRSTGGVWSLHLTEGRLERAQGKIAAPVLSALRRVGAEGRITGVVSMHGRGELRFSSSVPEDERQRFRNVWFCEK